MACQPPRSPQRRQRGAVALPGLSFQQLLLLAFLLIAGLLGASSLRALFTLEQLMGQSRDSAARAIELSATAQALSERGQTLERAARQSLVLGDVHLRERFDTVAQESVGIVQRLEASGLPPAQVRQWRDRLATVQQLLHGPAADAFDRERSVAAEFAELDTLHTAIAQSVQDMNATRGSALLAQVEASRRLVTQQVVAAIVLALVLALALGIWLARPFKRLERSIQLLGQNQLTQPVEIRGPVDVRRVGQQLEWLRMRLFELDADKARFLRHVSHELKTPLASLREGVALLQDGVAGEPSAGQREILHILQQNTVTLQGEIEALLRFNAAAFEARQLQRRDTDLLALLQEQAEAQRLQWQARSLQVVVRGDAVTLAVDPEKIASAVANLLSNAIRFSPPGGTVWLSLARVPGHVHIDVEDEGGGVAEIDRARIFEPFYRGERQPADAARGSGIGLSIVQELIAAHGGSVKLVEDGNHALFRIALPAAA